MSQENSYLSISSESGLWIKFAMDNKSMGTPTTCLTSSVSSVNFLSASDVPTEVPKCLTTIYTTAGEYTATYITLWIISKEKEVTTLQL